jgi:GH24 family phage-related lysozyme (muramidase)
MDRVAVIARLKKFEGCVSNMYLCTGGEVTIGVGHAIPTSQEASKLSWQIGGAAAAPAQAAADFERVAAAPKGMPASAYAGLTQCRMGEGDVEGLLEADLQSFEAQLAATLPKWNSYPEPVQEALFDMAFNLGLGGLKKFPRMLTAIDAGDWNTAAAQCHRQGIGEARNQEIAALFQSASTAQTPLVP